MPSPKNSAKSTAPLGRKKLPVLGEFSSTKKFQIYHGTGPTDTHTIIKESSILNDGVCLNIFQGFDRIKASFANLEDLGVPIFMDNGSFERFKAAFPKEKKKKKTEEGEEETEETNEVEKKGGKKKTSGKISIPLSVYFSEQASVEYFDYVTGEYQKLFKASKNPRNVIITVPEVIASAELTQKLQKKYLPTYKKWQDQYGFKMIISLQFNPHNDTWEHEMIESAKFIAENVDPNNPNVQRVGMPFGNDFKPIQNKDRFKKVDALFKLGGPLKGHGAHLFAAGMPIKVVSFTGDWVDSVDSSTLNQMAQYAHYLSKEGYYFDVRDIQGRAKSEKGKPPSKETVDAIWDIMYEEGVNPNKWMAAGTPAFNYRYRTLVENFDTVVARAKTWFVPEKVKPGVPMPGIGVPPELPPAIAVSTRSGGAMRSSNRGQPRKWDKLTTAVWLWDKLFPDNLGYGRTSARNVLRYYIGHDSPFSEEEIKDFAKTVQSNMFAKWLGSKGKPPEKWDEWLVTDLIEFYIKADLYNKTKQAKKLVQNVTKLEKIINQAKIKLARL